ncbi:hypothetical protein SAMN05216388_1006136 [Halorientalis persicus]|uniref:Uncharacterized protein n=1 Tax=Halorientalis persicus TaxID=1367881 RepID=A0A1H8KPQ1_9EURY|nr:hypothetical protein [Halorientalis persicus]SEN94879.1 hypothetical protein SAMN05216388_1006136 [Halorientalis persicus]
MSFRGDTRAASIALNHALTLGITAILISGLIIGAGQLVTRQEERVSERGLTDVNEVLISEIHQVDHLATTGDPYNVRSSVSLPSRVGGGGYNIELAVNGKNDVVLWTNTTTYTVPVKISNETAVCERALSGGPTSVKYDSGEDCITIESGVR